MNSLARRLRQLLGAAHEDAQRREVVRLAAPQAEPQERRRGQEDGALVRPAQLADLAALPRVGVVDDRGPDLQRHPQRHRVAEAVKERQDAEQPVPGLRVDGLDDRLGVGGDVAVAEHDPLGIAGAAAGKDHGGQVVGS